MLYLCIEIAVLFFAGLLLLASRLRLTIPLLYALLVPILCPDWYRAHEALGNGIFFALLALAALSWAVTLVRKAREWI